MTQELIIDNQQVDLSPDTEITLEYVSNLFGTIGQLHMSRSYTVKIPKTIRNARILDDPGRPGHESQKARKYLSARYYRNGIDLIGEGRAHVLSCTDDAYEIALVWNVVDNLAEWNNAKKKLTDLTGFINPSWSGAALATQSTTSGVFYAQYNSGLGGAYPNVNAARHPSVTLYELLTRSFANAGIPYSIGSSLSNALKTHALLVAPSHKPNLGMEITSGARATSLVWKTTSGSGSFWWFSGWSFGWDAPITSEMAESTYLQRGTTEELRVILNLKITGASPDLYLVLSRSGNDTLLTPTRTEDGGYLIDQTVSMEGLGAEETYDYYSLRIRGLADNGSYTFSAYDPVRPVFALIRPHDTIQIAHQNTFPIAENLPSIGQYDFMKALMGLFGIAAIVRNGSLHLDTYENILSKTNALDWSSKVDMTSGGGIRDLSYSLKGLAQKNRIVYESDVALPVSPDIVLECDDQTLEESKDLLKLPFAGSNGGEARHYKTSDAYDNEGNYYVELKDIDIKPRIFGFKYDSSGYRSLTFGPELQSQGAVSTYLSRYQEVIRKPVIIEVNIRLNEIDLAQLDLTRAVYLGQYGKYYMILKIQTSDTDLCKVQLLQLP